MGGLREHGLSTAQLSHQFPGIGRQVVQIVGRHTVSPQGVRQAFNGMPVEFEAWAHDQLFVADDSAAVENDGISVRFESRYRGLDPVHATGNGRAHGVGGLGGFEDPAADQRPARLVVVHIRRVDDGNVESWFAGQ